MFLLFVVVCLSRSEMKAQQLDVRFAPFQTFIDGKLGQQVCLGLSHLGSLAVSGLGSCGVRKVEP